MTRLTTVAACLAASALATSAYAQSQAEIAEKLNEEGKTLMFSGKYAEASAKLRAAVARVPEPKFFFNLCTSLFQEGKFGEALTACNAVANNNPSADQRAKADKLATRIKDEAKAQKVSIEPVGGGGGSTDDPALDCNATPDDARCQQEPPPELCKTNPEDPSCGSGDPNHLGGPSHGGDPNQGRYAVGRPPSGTGVFVSTTPDNKYTWTLGFEGFLGGGAVGQPNAYGSVASGGRIKGDYLLNPRARFGVQAYGQYTHFGQGAMDFRNAETLDIFDFGLAGYKHFCVAQRLCLTPLVGVHLAMMSPAGENDGESIVFNYAALGGRVELGAQYAFGTRYEHVLGLMAGANLYSQVLSGPDVTSIEDYGLDRGGLAAYFGLGYTYRFRTPLGSSPFVTLE